MKWKTRHLRDFFTARLDHTCRLRVQVGVWVGGWCSDLTDLQLHLQVVEQDDLQEKLLPSHDVSRKVEGGEESLGDGELQQEHDC